MPLCYATFALLVPPTLGAAGGKLHQQFSPLQSFMDIAKRRRRNISRKYDGYKIKALWKTNTIVVMEEGKEAVIASANLTTLRMRGSISVERIGQLLKESGSK